MSSVRQADDRPICQVKEHQTDSSLLSSIGSYELEEGCLSTSMRPPVNVCNSFVYSNKKSIKQMDDVLCPLNDSNIAPLWQQREWFTDLLSL